MVFLSQEPVRTYLPSGLKTAELMSCVWLRESVCGEASAHDSTSFSATSRPVFWCRGEGDQPALPLLLSSLPLPIEGWTSLSARPDLDPTRNLRAKGMTVDPWQRDLLLSTDRQILLNCSRSAGKSETESALALHTALFRPHTFVLLISRAQRQAHEQGPLSALRASVFATAQAEMLSAEDRSTKGV